MKIVQIKFSPLGKKFQLFLDQTSRPLSIGKETFLKLSLKVGDEIDSREIRRIDLAVSLLEKTLSWLALRPRSEKEIKDYLAKKTGSFKSGNLLAEEVVGKLRELKLIDDEKFAFWWLEQRQQFRPKGRWALSGELKQKGISRQLIDQVLSQALSQENESELAIKVLLKTGNRFNKLALAEKKQKLYGSLARRGFGYEIIRDAIDEYLEKS